MTGLAFQMDDSTPSHVTVMRDEVVAAMRPLGSGLIIDATLGYGGHTLALLNELPGVSVIGFDQDGEAVRASLARLGQFAGRFQAVHARFSCLPDWLAAHGIGQIDGLIADLGVSSPQLSDTARGMSFRSEGPLDMRMDRSRGETALELIRRLSQDDLADVIYTFGEERRSRRIAACIKQLYDQDQLNSTLDLRRAVIKAIGPRRIGGIDPATRTFQALRVAVNRELHELTSLLDRLHELVRPEGTAALISFHSLEDRRVKRCFQERALWKRHSAKPLLPTTLECDANPRARSAKLRIATRSQLAEVPPVLPEGVDPREFST